MELPEAHVHHHQLHVFFFPFMAHGHMIPLVDVARLFAAHGVKCTVITTPLNASLFSATLARDRRSGRDINVTIIQFPSLEVGLPQGCERLDHFILTSHEAAGKFLKALYWLQQPVEQLLLEHRPDYIVADMLFPWVTDIAGKLGIPRFGFQVTSFFALSVLQVLIDRAEISTSSSSSDVESNFIVPDLPDKIEMKRSQMQDKRYFERSQISRESETKTTTAIYGTLVNSFYELEPAYVEHHRTVLGKKAWHIGPVSILCNKAAIDKAQRGHEGSIDANYYLNWLDDKKEDTVLYVCFGSLCRFTNRDQLREIANALEASGCPFIWVIRTPKKEDGEEEEKEESYLPEDFRERIEGRGLIIKNWAPQLLILDHPAIGGFMTHCGWNSVLEGVSSGVPLITWPMFGEHFYHEKLVTQVLRVGIEIGIERWSSWPILVDTLVKKERIEKAINRLMMGDGEEAQETRRRAKELGQMAQKAVENGGSSHCNFADLIEELKTCKRQ